MQVIISPAGSTAAVVHYQKTVEKMVPLTRIRGLVDQDVAKSGQQSQTGYCAWTG